MGFEGIWERLLTLGGVLVDIQGCALGVTPLGGDTFWVSVTSSPTSAVLVPFREPSTAVLVWAFLSASPTCHLSVGMQDLKAGQEGPFPSQWLAT